MPYYLSLYEEVSVPTFPLLRRPVGGDQPGWSAIDLRPDRTRLDGGGLNACLLYLSVANPDARLTLIGLDPADQLGSLATQVLNTRLGLSVSPGRLDQVIADIMTSPRGWPMVTPALDGMHRIWLGPYGSQGVALLKAWPSISGGVDVQDNFNRTATLDGSTSSDGQFTWSQFLGAGNSTNGTVVQLDGTGGSDSMVRAQINMASASHFTQIVVVTLSPFASGNQVAVAVICNKDATATQSFYMYQVVVQNAGVNEHDMYRDDAGVFTQLGATDATNFAANETIYIENNGGSITGKRNSVTSVGPVTDNTYTFLRTGLRLYNDNNPSSTGTADDYRAADLAAAGRDDLGTPVMRSRMREW